MPPNLERLVYVSTAYVAGTRTGVVYEHELMMGQDFKNHYESTKFQAEVWVRDAMDRVPTTILRPAIVVGDSRTGETQKFDGPYYILRVISARERRRAIPQLRPLRSTLQRRSGRLRGRRHRRGRLDQGGPGETLHLVDPEPLTAAELTEALSMEYAQRTPRGRIPPALAAASLRLRPLRARLGGAPRESIAYLNHPVSFDTRRAVSILGAHGFQPPGFREYMTPMVEFFRAHEGDPKLIPS